MSSDDPEVLLDPSLFDRGPIDIDLQPQNPPPTKKINKKEGTSGKSLNTKQKNKKEESDSLESKPKQTKGANWRVEEDEALCKSWLNTSKDATTGTNQNKSRFWQQIHEMFVDLMEEVTGKKKNNKGFKPFPMRSQKPLEDRWYHVLHQVSKYCGCLVQVKRRARSGSNQIDFTLEAKALFRQDNGNKQFGLDHCWALLHCHQKWLEYLNEAALGGKSKPKKVSRGSSPAPSTADVSSSGQPQESEIEVSGRPEGCKAAKKRKNDEINISELIKSQKEMLELSRKKQESFESSADDMVMGHELTGMDKEALEYFKEKRKLAWERLKKKKID
ncbi:hypothetical protein PSTG_00577 [Puccinia striiformis f. sp. tritici PST-78]|uniref:No apical meristem-associated C-terminal domain-containing protein n=1 Tax=Puccinia striiformis f. sp. tritici PST-78 TaxID=1165861 RepID=A0A0L0W3D9_9BASI|nr:hypothetical protein PSTG_00577 [Puccinia striiformis f. sp. tritici PST-78]